MAKDKKDSFIKLERPLIHALGLECAVVLCQLIGHADINKNKNKKGEYYLQYDRFSSFTGLDKRTIRKYIKQLEELKLITVKRHTEKNKNIYILNKYKILIVKEVSLNTDVNEWLKKKDANSMKMLENAINFDNNTSNFDNISEYKNDSIKDTNTKENNKVNKVDMMHFSVHQDNQDINVNDSKDDEQKKCITHITIFNNQANKKLEKHYTKLTAKEKSIIYEIINNTKEIGYVILGHEQCYKNYINDGYFYKPSFEQAKKDIDKIIEYTTSKEYLGGLDLEYEHYLKMMNYWFTLANVNGDYHLQLLISSPQWLMNAYNQEIY